MDFPNIALPDLGFPESIEDGTISTPMEAGYKQTRPRFTKDRRSWTLSWEEVPLSPGDYEILMTFQAQVRGGQAFNWTHPISHTVYVARATFNAFRPVETNGILGWAGSILLEEV